MAALLMLLCCFRCIIFHLIGGLEVEAGLALRVSCAVFAAVARMLEARTKVPKECVQLRRRVWILVGRLVTFLWLYQGGGGGGGGNEGVVVLIVLHGLVQQRG